MGLKNEAIKISYQKVTPVDFAPDIDGAFDILFSETLKDYKLKQIRLPRAQIGYCNVSQSNLS